MRASPSTFWLPTLALLTACSAFRDSRPTAKETRSSSSFTAVEAGGAVEVDIDVGPDTQVQVLGDQDAVDDLRTEVVDETLVISNEDWLGHDGNVKIRITTPTLERLEASGASRFDVRGVSTDAMDIEASGASKIQVQGKAERLEADVSGASRLQGRELEVDTADIHASGASSVEITVNDRLEAHASGASRITYLGGPSEVDPHESGASSIRPD